MRRFLPLAVTDVERAAPASGRHVATFVVSGDDRVVRGAHGSVDRERDSRLAATRSKRCATA